MDVTFRQLRLFLALAENGSVSAVARRFHVSQPTVSMQLRDLSESVGLPLYEVISKRVYLTPVGEELARSGRAMMEEWAGFGDQVAAMKGLTRGRLRLAVVSTAKYFVPRLLGFFCAKHPDIEISLEVLNRDGVVQRLRANRDDLYIMSLPPRDIDVVCRTFVSNPLVMVASAGHRLLGKKAVCLKDLAKERFILREPGSGTRLCCDHFLQKEGFYPDVRLELGSNEAIKQAVAGGLGLSILSKHALGDAVNQNSLGILNVEGFPIRSHWFTVHLAGKRLSPTAQAFLDFLIDQAPQLEAGVQETRSDVPEHGDVFSN